MKLQCCFPNCTDTRSDTPIYYFPNPVDKRELFEEWVNIIGGELLQMDYADIYENRFICGRHFQTLAMHKVFQKPVCTDKQRKRRDNSASVNNSESNRQMPNFETVNLDIKIEPNVKIEPETLTMDAVNAMENVENSDSDNLPYITHVKSEALNSASDEDEMPWESALNENDTESELIIPDKSETEQTDKIDMHEPLIDIIETKTKYGSKMSWETDVDEKIEISNTVIDKRSYINQSNEATEISEPLINNVKIKKSCKSEMVCGTDLDENITNEPVIDKDVEVRQINDATETKKPSIRVINLGNDREIINNDNRVSKDVTPKSINKVYIPINAASKYDVATDNNKNGSLENGIDNLLRERRDTPGFSDKSTPMHITKVTSDRDTFRTTMKKQNSPTSQQLSNVNSVHPTENIRHNLDRLVQNLAFPKDSAEALELAHIANQVLLEYETMKVVSSSYEVKRKILKNRIRSLNSQLKETEYTLKVIRDLNKRPNNAGYETVTKDMSPQLKNLFDMQVRLSKAIRKKFTTDEMTFALGLFKCSRKAYTYLSKTLILPSVWQVKKWASKELPTNDILKSDCSSNDDSMTKEDTLINNTEAIKPPQSECKPETKNVLVSKGAIETHTGDDINFEDMLDRDKWVVRKVERKTSSTSNDSYTTDCSNSESLNGLLVTCKSNNQPDTNSCKYKEASNLITVYDSEETISVCDDFTYIKESEKDEQVERQVSRKLDKRGVRNKSNDLKRVQTTTNTVKRRKSKSNAKRKNADDSDDSEDATAAKLSKDNVVNSRRNRKDIGAKKSRNDTVHGSDISRRHSSRLASKRTSNPQDELKT